MSGMNPQHVASMLKHCRYQASELYLHHAPHRKNCFPLSSRASKQPEELCSSLYFLRPCQPRPRECREESWRKWKHIYELFIPGQALTTQAGMMGRLRPQEFNMPTVHFLWRYYAKTDHAESNNGHAVSNVLAKLLPPTLFSKGRLLVTKLKLKVGPNPRVCSRKFYGGVRLFSLRKIGSNQTKSEH